MHIPAQQPDTVHSAFQRTKGFTLFEVLVVLSVLTLLISITWPAVNRYTDEYRLRNAAADLRAKLYETRQQAIQLGTTVSFRFQDLSLHYEISSVIPPIKTSGTLPEEIHFRLADQTAAGHSGNPLTASVASSPIVSSGTGTFNITWEQPVQFLPDGSIGADHEIYLEDENGKAVLFTFRGLTGGIEMSSVLQKGLP